MATFNGQNWNNLRGLVATGGVYASVYRPGGSGETVDIRLPTGAITRVPTPKLADWFLAAEDGKVTVYYLAIADGGHDFRRVPTAIQCGQALGALVTGGVGPQGPAGPQGPQGERGQDGHQGPPGQAGEDAMALTDDDLNRIAERVWLMPPPEHLKGLAGVDLGTLSQIIVAYLLTQRQDVWAGAIPRIDEAALGLLQGGYQPKVK